jgi:hypothetical protein
MTNGHLKREMGFSGSPCCNAWVPEGMFATCTWVWPSATKQEFVRFLQTDIVLVVQRQTLKAEVWVDIEVLDYSWFPISKHQHFQTPTFTAIVRRGLFEARCPKLNGSLLLTCNVFPYSRIKPIVSICQIDSNCVLRSHYLIMPYPRFWCLNLHWPHMFPSFDVFDGSLCCHSPNQDCPNPDGSYVARPSRAVLSEVVHHLLYTPNNGYRNNN